MCPLPSKCNCIGEKRTSQRALIHGSDRGKRDVVRQAQRHRLRVHWVIAKLVDVHQPQQVLAERRVHLARGKDRREVKEV